MSYIADGPALGVAKSATWQGIETEVRRRISERVWKPGELIPGEMLLAKEFGCARATVNRALRQLAEAGLLERRRKGGTRVARHPVRKATLDISITRHEVEQRGKAYSFTLLARKLRRPSQPIQTAMGLEGGKHLYLETLHMAGGAPFMLETRWVNVGTVPEILEADLETHNANEWLIEHALFSHGDITFSAANADAFDAKQLSIDEGAAIFTVTRSTWNGLKSITHVRLAYAPGFEMQTQI